MDETFYFGGKSDFTQNNIFTKSLSKISGLWKKPDNFEYKIKKNRSGLKVGKVSQKLGS